MHRAEAYRRGYESAFEKLALRAPQLPSRTLPYPRPPQYPIGHANPAAEMSWLSNFPGRAESFADQMIAAHTAEHANDLARRINNLGTPARPSTALTRSLPYPEPPAYPQGYLEPRARIKQITREAGGRHFESDELEKFYDQMIAAHTAEHENDLAHRINTVSGGAPLPRPTPPEPPPFQPDTWLDRAVSWLNLD